MKNIAPRIDGSKELPEKLVLLWGGGSQLVPGGLTTTYGRVCAGLTSPLVRLSGLRKRSRGASRSQPVARGESSSDVGRCEVSRAFLSALNVSCAVLRGPRVSSLRLWLLGGSNRSNGEASSGESEMFGLRRCAPAIVNPAALYLTRTSTQNQRHTRRNRKPSAIQE